MGRKKQILWHYTTGQKYLKIISLGALLTEKETTPYALGSGDKGFLWFTASQKWEPTANKMWQNPDGQTILLTKEQTEELGSGLYRFGVYLGPSFLHWKNLKAKINKDVYKHLEGKGLAQGANPNLWYASTKPIPIEKCCRIEKHQSGQWVDAKKEASPTAREGEAPRLTPQKSGSPILPGPGKNNQEKNERKV